MALESEGMDMSDYEKIVNIETNIFDEREIHTNCTVEIWRNSVTGKTSIGWWDNEEPPAEMGEEE